MLDRRSFIAPDSLSEPLALLRGQLADGPKPGSLIEATAEAAAVHKRALIAAAWSTQPEGSLVVAELIA
jgi:hypothetical protein